MNAPSPIKILAITGSLRRESCNTALLRAAQALAEKDVEFDIATLHGIPLYDGDFEAQSGIPPAVDVLKARIVASDALLIATPEYNNSMPGVLKNAIDWLSRPPADIARVFGDKPVAMIGASPSGFGTVLAQNAWLPVLRTLGTQQWSGGRLMVSRADRVFSADGELIDDVVRKQLGQYMQNFTHFIRKSLAARSAP